MAYNKLKLLDLKKLLDERNLSTRHNKVKADFIKTLEDDDRRVQSTLRNERPQALSYRGRDNASNRSETFRPDQESYRTVSSGSAPRQLSDDPTSRCRGIDAEQARAHHLSEDALEQLCRDNYVPFVQDYNGVQKRADVTAEYNVRVDAANKKLDTATKKHQTEVAKARTERDDRLNENQADVDQRRKKWRAFNDAFKLLKELRVSQGRLPPRIPDFNPMNNHRLYGQAAQARIVNPDSEALRERPTLRESGPLRGDEDPGPRRDQFRDMENTIDRTPPRDREIAFPSTPLSVLSSSATQISKRKASSSTLAPSASAEKRARTESDYIYDTGPLRQSLSASGEKRPRTFNDSDVPRGPRDEHPIVESEPIRRQLTNNPYIFVPTSNVAVIPKWMLDIAKMVRKNGFAPKHVRADDTGYFIVFEASVQGESQAKACFSAFDGTNFKNAVFEMELHVRA